MARLFAEAGYDVAFTTAKGMLERVKATFDEGGTEAAVARYAKCDVLVLDDLGKEDATEWSVGTVFSVLDARYEDPCARPSSRRTTRRARWRTGSRGAASA